MIQIDEDIQETKIIPAGCYISMQEYAKKYGIPYSTVRKKVSLGSISSVIIEGKRMIPDQNFVPDL